jgi:protein TonB
MQLMKMMAKSDPRQRPPMIVFKESEVIPFELVERAPIPSDCSPTLDNSALKECTRDSIRWHVNRKFDIGITATEGRAKGIYKINTKFIIDSTGEIVNIEIESDSQLLSDEAYRVISSISTMRPGMHEGNPIHVTYTLPITLSVQ